VLWGCFVGKIDNLTHIRYMYFLDILGNLLRIKGIEIHLLHRVTHVYCIQMSNFLLYYYQGNNDQQGKKHNCHSLNNDHQGMSIGSLMLHQMVYKTVQVGMHCK
jgi:hypothetical protein